MNDTSSFVFNGFPVHHELGDNLLRVEHEVLEVTGTFVAVEAELGCSFHLCFEELLTLASKHLKHDDGANVARFYFVLMLVVKGVVSMFGDCEHM